MTDLIYFVIFLFNDSGFPRIADTFKKKNTLFFWIKVFMKALWKNLMKVSNS